MVGGVLEEEDEFMSFEEVDRRQRRRMRDELEEPGQEFMADPAIEIRPSHVRR